MISVFLYFLFFPIFHRSSHLLGSSRPGCLLACLVRGVDGLCGLCVAPCSRLIASGSSGILFLVPCDGFLSAFLFLARCYWMSGFIPSLYRSRPPTPSSFLLGYQGRGRFFYRDFPLLACPIISLAYLMSCPSADYFVLCGYHDSISQYRPVLSPRLFDTASGEIMAMRCLLAGRDCRLSYTGCEMINVIHLMRQC